MVQWTLMNFCLPDCSSIRTYVTVTVAPTINAKNLQPFQKRERLNESGIWSITSLTKFSYLRTKKRLKTKLDKTINLLQKHRSFPSHSTQNIPYLYEDAVKVGSKFGVAYCCWKFANRCECGWATVTVWCSIAFGSTLMCWYDCLFK